MHGAGRHAMHVGQIVRIEDGIKQFGAQHLLLLRDLTHGGVPDKRLLRDGHGPFVADLADERSGQ